MSELVDVGRIKYIKDYKYEIEFEDGLTGIVDFSEFLNIGPVFKPLKDIKYFKKAIIDGGTIAWPNGADISPETLYEKVEMDRSGNKQTATKRSRTQQANAGDGRSPRLRG